jgi:hypothetical protein
MKKIRYRLKGHESFVLREGWLTQGIKAVSENCKLYSTNSGADALGVGTNMAKSIRYWMKTAGVTSESSAKGVRLTDLGTVILNKDLYIEDIFTLWIVHANIVCNFDNATSWNIFFNRINLTTPFVRDELAELLKALIIECTGDENPSERSIKDDCSALLSMYARGGSPEDDPEDKRPSPFEDLGLVERVGNRFVKKRPSYDNLDKLVVLYLIIDKLNLDGSMQIDHLTDADNMPGKVLNLNRIAVNEYLDQLQNAGYITVNRTAGLDIIYPAKCKDMTKTDVIDTYYQGGRAK